MNFDIGNIIAGLIFGVFGFYIFRRGRQVSNMKSVLIGLALMIYPYFVDNAFIVWGTGFALLFIGYKTLE